MAKRFAGAMATFADEPTISPSLLANGYSWRSIGNGNGTVVDVGGGKGNISVIIAQNAPGLRFVVQDLPGALQGAQDTIPKDITPRLEFMAHDFFQDQPVQADVFLFRMIFHNWADKYVVKILRATIPGLKPGSRVVINDYVVPQPKTMSLMKERTIRQVETGLTTESFSDSDQGNGHDHADFVQFTRSRRARMDGAFQAGRHPIHRCQDLGTKGILISYH